LEIEDRNRSGRVSLYNLVLSTLIFVTIFISIIAIFLNNYTIHYHSIPKVYNVSHSEVKNFIYLSVVFTFALSIIAFIIFYISIRISGIIKNVILRLRRLLDKVFNKGLR
jgi:drug/metabolite transporter (DMT)-like permease